MSATRASWRRAGVLLKLMRKAGSSPIIEPPQDCRRLRIEELFKKPFDSLIVNT